MASSPSSVPSSMASSTPRWPRPGRRARPRRRCSPRPRCAAGRPGRWPHLLQGERDAVGGVGVLVAGHEVVELAVAAQVGADEVGVGRVGVVADVDVEGQVADLAGVLGAGVAHPVGEPEVGGVGGVDGRGVAPGFLVGEGFAVGDSVFFVLSCVWLFVAPPQELPRVSV